MMKLTNVLTILILGFFLINSCGNKKDNQEKKYKQTKEAEALYKSFIKKDSLPFEFTEVFLSYVNWRRINYNSINRFIDPDLRKHNRKMDNIIDSLNKINAQREIYEPLGTPYDEKFWHIEELDYVYNGLDYIGMRYLYGAQNFAILLYMKIDRDEYSSTPEYIASPLILATHQLSNGERIDSIQIDYLRLIENLGDGTGHLIIKEEEVSLKYGAVEKDYKFDAEGKFVQK